ncbi:alveolin domain containing intermediate filament imc9 [Cystoisospora suis]|uniref:Alveolin domain containing intermediate filament imc9 n=1 Tax=Cystoisospora suis TaxID=483139 RepID=A0A2C6L7V2_9APIC|nr:alveolin domain containing intermediate filament imc9 [Cystoisospora suis]
MEGEKWCRSSSSHSGAFSSPAAPPPPLKPCVAAVAAVGFAPGSPPRLCVPKAQPPAPSPLSRTVFSRCLDGDQLGLSPARTAPLSPISSCPGIRLPSPPATCCYSRSNGSEGFKPSSTDFGDPNLGELLQPPTRQMSLACPPCQEKAQRRPLPSKSPPKTSADDQPGATRRAAPATPSTDSALHSCATDGGSLHSSSERASGLSVPERSPRPSASLPSPPRTSPGLRSRGLTLSVPSLSPPSIESARRLHPRSSVQIPERFACEPQIVEKVIHVPKITYEEKITEVPQVMLREHIVEVPEIIHKEKVVKVPKLELVEKIVEVPVVKYVDRVVEVPQHVVKEKFVEVDEIIRQEKVIPVPKIEIVEKIVKQPKIVMVEKYVDVPRIEYREVEIEKIVEVPQIQIKYVEREVPVPQKVYRHIDVTKIVEVPQQKIVEKIVRVPVPRYIEVPKYIEQVVPREKFVKVEKKIERKVPTPQPQDSYQEIEKPVFRTKYIERPVPVPTEKIVEEHVDVEVPREVIVEKRVPVVRRVEKPVEVPVPVPSGDPMILTEEGYIPLAEFAQKTHRLTPKQAEFYQRQSESATKQLRSLSSATLQSGAGSVVSGYHAHYVHQQTGQSSFLDYGPHMATRDRPQPVASQVSRQEKGDQQACPNDVGQNLQREPLPPALVRTSQEVSREMKSSSTAMHSRPPPLQAPRQEVRQSSYPASPLSFSDCCSHCPVRPEESIFLN